MKFWIIKCTAGWLKTSNKKLSYKVVVHQLETDEEQGEPGVGVGCRLVSVPVMWFCPEMGKWNHTMCWSRYPLLAWRHSQVWWDLIRSITYKSDYPSLGKRIWNDRSAEKNIETKTGVSPGLHDGDPKRQGFFSLRKQMLTGDLTATRHYFEEISTDKGNLYA